MIKACLICKKEFKNSHQRIKCCSRKCGGINRRGRKSPNNKRILKNCLFCNREFMWKISASYGKYCSRECGYLAKRGIPSILAGKIGERVDLKCLNCGIIKKVTPGELKRRKYCSKKCSDNSIEAKNQLQQLHNKPREYFQQIGVKGLIRQQNMNGQPTSIEKIVYDYLILKGIIFEKQKEINGKFVVDAYIPSLNLVIEADGKYWHSLPKAIKRDKSKNAYLKKCGFKLIRLSEEEINSGKFRERMVF